jgi:signal transduction histidine kinase/ActR/RegA family two-component response regulator
MGARVKGRFSLTSRWRPWPIAAVAGAIALLLAGLFMGLASEASYRAQRVRETAVQADILAASLAAPLAFDDRQTAQEYVDALGANPDLQAVGVYNETGALVAHYVRSGAPPPARAPPPRLPSYRLGHVELSSAVTQGGGMLGEVYLRTGREPMYAAFARQTGVSMLVAMAFLFVLVLGMAQSTLRRANSELEGRARDLSEANRQLQIQMEEREKAEEALRQSQKMEALGQLTGGVAHDFNNILMVASSGLDLLDRTADPARRQALKEGIRQAVDRGAGLTRQLLAISRRTSLQPQVLDLRSQIESMRVLLDHSLRGDISVALAMDEDLWPIEVDPSQLEVAILNIAVNARDAMPEGGLITIEARNIVRMAEAELVGDFVRLSIRDEGQGMSRETLRRIFEPFFTTKGVGKGTGLGLAQVYGFGRASGGDVRVESELGRGTVISLYLPRAARAAEPDRRIADASELMAPSEPQGRVMLVEDEDSVADVVTQMMRELGYDVRRTASAAAALRMIEADPAFDLVFSDMVMPGRMNGVELAREIAQRRPDLPVLLTTGFSEAATAAREHGYRLLAKPYRMEALAEALNEVRRDRRPSTAAEEGVS